jgi:hypothetical protein
MTKADQTTVLSQPLPGIKSEVLEKDDDSKLDEKFKNSRKRSSTPPKITRELRKRQPISYAEGSRRKPPKSRSASVSGKAKSETPVVEKFENTNLINSTAGLLKNELVPKVTKQAENLSNELDKDTQHETEKQAVTQKDSNSAEQKQPNAKSTKKSNAKIAFNPKDTSRYGVKRKVEKASQHKSAITASTEERSQSFFPLDAKTSNSLSLKSLPHLKSFESAELVSAAVSTSVGSDIVSAKDITEAKLTKLDHKIVDKGFNDATHQSVAALDTEVTESVATKDESLKSAAITTIAETLIKTVTSGDSDNNPHTERPQSNEDKTEKVITYTENKEIFESGAFKKDSSNSETDLPVPDNNVKAEPVDIESFLPIADSPGDKRNLIVSADIKSDTTADIKKDFPSDITTASSLSKLPDPVLERHFEAFKVQQQTTVQKPGVFKHESTEINSNIREGDSFDTVGKSKNTIKPRTSESQTVLGKLKSSQPESSLAVTKSTLSKDSVKIETDARARVNDTPTETEDSSQVESKPILSLLNDLDGKTRLVGGNSSKVKPVVSTSDLSTTQSEEIELVFASISNEKKPNFFKSDNSLLPSVPNMMESQPGVPKVTIGHVKDVAMIPASTVQPVSSMAKDTHADFKSVVKSKSPAGKAPPRISVMEAMLRALPSSAITRKHSLRNFSSSKTQIGNASASSASKLAIPVTASVDLASNDLATSGSSSLNVLALNTDELSKGIAQTKNLASTSDLITITDQPVISKESNDHAEIATVPGPKTLVSIAHSPVVGDSESARIQVPRSAVSSTITASSKEMQTECLEPSANLDNITDSKPSDFCHSPVTQRPTKSRKKASNAKDKKPVELSTVSSGVLSLSANVGDSKGLVEKQKLAVATKLPPRTTRLAKAKALSKASVSIETVPVKEKMPAVKNSSDKNQSKLFTTSKPRDSTAKYGTPSKQTPGVTRKSDHLTDLRIFRDAVKSEIPPRPAIFSQSPNVTRKTKDLLTDITMEERSMSADQTSVEKTASLTGNTSSEVLSLPIAEFKKATEESANITGLDISGEKNSELRRHETFNLKLLSENHGTASDVSAFSDVTDRSRNYLTDEGKSTIASSVIRDSDASNPVASSSASKPEGNILSNSHLPFQIFSESPALKEIELTEAATKRDDSLENFPSSTFEPIIIDPLGSNESIFNKSHSRIATLIEHPDQELDTIPELMKSLKMPNESEKPEFVGLDSRATPDRPAASLGDRSAAPSGTIGEAVFSKQTAEIAASEVSPSKLSENKTGELIVQSPSRIHDHIEPIPKLPGEKDESARSRKKSETPILRRPPSARLRKLRSDPALANKYHKLFNTPFQFVFDDNKRHDVTPDDFIKLDDGEYLNDTLINFYLKYHHQLMMKANEDVAKLVYIFNTFFYEKLAQKNREGNVGYDFVKNWTTKVDLFKMKYVIVPINMKMHWYLAIIHNLPALLREKKENEDGDEIVTDSKAASTEPEAASDSQPLTDNPSADGISVDNGLPSATEQTAAAPENPGSNENKDTVAGTTETKENSQERVFTRVTRTSTHTYIKKPSKESVTRAARTRKISIEDDCVIFILDSFKSRNYSVLSRNLKEYICKEAMDKLNITVEKQRIITKQVDVPQQNNFCDCGVYLIHYVERFLGAPAKIVELMAKAMKGADHDIEVTNELLRMWETSAIAKKRGMLKSEIIMCKNKQEKQQEAEQELNQIFNESQQQQSSQPSIQSGATTPSKNNDHNSIGDLGTNARADKAGNSSDATGREVGSADDDEDVVVVDVMKKNRRGQKRGQR